MTLNKLPDNVIVHSGVWRKIKEIRIHDPKKATRIVQRITELGFDPLPAAGDCESRTIVNLNKLNIKVRRLKCLEFLDYRIFYAYKKKFDLICVYCIIPRDEDTYDESSRHYQLVKLLYTQWSQCK